MRKKALACILTGIMLMMIAAPALAMVSSTKLIEDSKTYDGRVILYEGEAIGDVMERGDFGWVNLHDGHNAIGVWAPVADLEKIEIVGDYKHIGDRVLVEGVFNLACEEHQGEFDIHAESFTIVKSGRRVEHRVDARKIIAAAILVPVALALYFIDRYRRRHMVGTL